MIGVTTRGDEPNPNGQVDCTVRGGGVPGWGRSLAVYRCADPLLERQVAVIIVNESGFGDLAGRLLYSQRILAGLLHPNIVTVYDA